MLILKKLYRTSLEKIKEELRIGKIAQEEAEERANAHLYNLIDILPTFDAIYPKNLVARLDNVRTEYEIFISSLKIASNNI